MFQFRRFPTYAYLIQRTLTEYCSAGFPHSEISGSMAICASPKLIAACHVLHRLLMPRHSPCALISLTYFLSRKKVGKESFKLFCLFFRKEVVTLLVLLSSNYAGFRFNKIIVLPFCYQKVPQLRLFPSVACSSYFGYFVQFSRCGSDLKSDSNTCQNKCLNPNSASIKVFFAYFLVHKKVSGGPKWTRTTDLTIISRAL